MNKEVKDVFSCSFHRSTGQTSGQQEKSHFIEGRTISELEATIIKLRGEDGIL